MEEKTTQKAGGNFLGSGYIKGLAVLIFVTLVGASWLYLDGPGASEVISLIRTNTPTPTATPTPTPTPVPTATPTPIPCKDEIGCVTYRPGEPIRIASALLISGSSADLGIDSQYGVELAIDFQGQILGHDVELQPEDDKCSAEGGNNAGRKIVADPSILAVVGTSCSGAAISMSEIISDAGYVMVSPSNTSPSLTNPNQAWNPGYLRTAHNDLVLGVTMAVFVYNELEFTTAAVIHDGGSYTEGLADTFQIIFEELGGTVVVTAAIDYGEEDYRSVLNEVANAKGGPPEFIFYPVYTDECVLLTQQAREIPRLKNTVLGTSDACISNRAVAGMGAAGDGMYFSSPDLFFSGAAHDELLEAYQEKYGTGPLSWFYPHAFDAANMIFACIEEVALVEDDGTIHVGRQALRDCLYATEDFEGITGTLTCTKYGDCSAQEFDVLELEDQEFQEVW